MTGLASDIAIQAKLFTLENRLTNINEFLVFIDVKFFGG
jgi:hypothetical protein